jgi:ATP-dependent RNA helicase RhlE
MNFQDFPLHPTLLENISTAGYQQATDIQMQVMPLALEGKDVSGLSRTGTGKTAAFLIPTLQRLTALEKDRLALCLTPTRELAQQIQAEGNRLGKNLDIPTVSIVGGMSSEDQVNALKGGARLITGTPGRIIDLFKERMLDLAKVDVLVFDEADRMFDMGFVKDMQYILSKVNPQRQILLFSATMNFSVLNMIYEYGADPQEINVSRDQVTADKIEQVLYHVGDDEKPAALLGVCKKHCKENGSIIVFVNYKERVGWVAAMLTKNGIPAQGLSSMLRQEKRNKTIEGFKTGKFRALVATDVASRGLDVDDISLVVNYHLPEEAATYVHRIGRTARAGRDGIAVNICSSEDAYNQMRVEEFLGKKIPVQWFADDELPKDVLFPSRHEQEDDDEAEGEGREDRQGRDRNRGRDRGDRGMRKDRKDGRDSRGRDRNRSERGPREERAPLGAPVPVGAEALATGESSAEVRAPQEARGPRTDRPRHERQERHERSERPERPERMDRQERSDRPDRNRGRDRSDRRDGRHSRPIPADAASAAPTELPSPITGNPVIYDMKTGRPKNRSDDEFRKTVRAYENRLKSDADKFSGKKKAAPAIIKKISSKVTALFGSRGK